MIAKRFNSAPASFAWMRTSAYAPAPVARVAPAPVARVAPAPVARVAPAPVAPFAAVMGTAQKVAAVRPPVWAPSVVASPLATVRAAIQKVAATVQQQLAPIPAPAVPVRVVPKMGTLGAVRAVPAVQVRAVLQMGGGVRAVPLAPVRPLVGAPSSKAGLAAAAQARAAARSASGANQEAWAFAEVVANTPAWQQALQDYNAGRPVTPLGLKYITWELNNYFQQGQAAQGRLTHALAVAAIRQWLIDRAPSGFDVFLSKVSSTGQALINNVVGAVALAPNAIIQGRLPTRQEALLAGRGILTIAAVATGAGLATGAISTGTTGASAVLSGGAASSGVAASAAGTSSLFASVAAALPSAAEVVAGVGTVASTAGAVVQLQQAQAAAKNQKQAATQAQILDAQIAAEQAKAAQIAAQQAATPTPAQQQTNKGAALLLGGGLLALLSFI